MFWFSGLTDAHPDEKELYLVALKTANKYTTLKPVLMYDGDDDDFKTEVESFGCTVVKHQTTLGTRPSFVSKPQESKNAAVRTLLRVDVPLVCANLAIIDDTVLYTDPDVIFLDDVVPDLYGCKPVFFSTISPSSSSDDTNLGVMLLNRVAMLTTYAEFADFVESKDYRLCFNEFYSHRQRSPIRLPLHLNHKPVWGRTSDAKIVNYSDCRPNDIRAFLMKGDTMPNSVFAAAPRSVWVHYANL
jgi:hypothetical protein